MSTTGRPRYTAEVEAAMRAQGLLPAQPPPPPAGQIRYHVAVGESLLSGVADPSTIAAALRGLADQLDTL